MTKPDTVSKAVTQYLTPDGREVTAEEYARLQAGKPATQTADRSATQTADRGTKGG